MIASTSALPAGTPSLGGDWSMALEDPAVETHCSGALAARVSLTIIHAAPSGTYSILPCPPPCGACLGADGSRLTQAFDRYTGFAHRMRAQRVSIDSRGSRTSGGVGEHINRGSGQGVRKGYLLDALSLLGFKLKDPLLSFYSSSKLAKNGIKPLLIRYLLNALIRVIWPCCECSPSSRRCSVAD